MMPRAVIRDMIIAVGIILALLFGMSSASLVRPARAETCKIMQQQFDFMPNLVHPRAPSMVNT